MPGIDGLKATQFIRNEMNISESDMPVICISAASVNEDWQKYRNAGMNAFLPKPFTEEMLLTTILSVIKDYVPITVTAAVSEEKIKPAGIDKINLTNLYHISGGDEQFVKQMLVSFIDSTKKGIIDIQEAIISGHLASLEDLAHKMLPPCRHIGATDLCNLLRKIEESNQQNISQQALESLIRESSSEFEAVSELINKRIANII
jgi:CheY-like chemotaxis protein